MSESTSERKGIAIQPNSTAESLFEVHHLSHDLRGPLNSILGFTELLLEEIEGPLTDIQKEDITAINQSAQNLLYLINTMVDLSKLDAGRLEFNFGEVSLNQVVRDVLSSDTLKKPKGIEIVVYLPETLPSLWGDSNRLTQMMEGLLNSASALRETREIMFMANEEATEVNLQISCVGGRIPPQELSEIFKLMVKTDAAGRSHLGPGGLELPLVQRIIDQHGGRIWVEGSGTGTTFFLSLPTAEAKRQTADS
ncbi:MAG: HAMP domain-containing histidine kinase [Anaerolineae bacterium]|nr:HAMP domain-containing histidine kinase [Anaerolineae bacterium]